MWSIKTNCHLPRRQLSNSLGAWQSSCSGQIVLDESFCSLSIVLSAISDGQYIPGEQFYGFHKFHRYSLLKGDLGYYGFFVASGGSIVCKVRGDPENLALALIHFLLVSCLLYLLFAVICRAATGGRMFLEQLWRSQKLNALGSIWRYNGSIDDDAV